MIGERLHIGSRQKDAASMIMALVMRFWSEKHIRPLALSIAGESGSGKTSIAYCLVELLLERNHTCILLGQDDYFKIPPRDNHSKRKETLAWVGPGEVRLKLLDRHIMMIKKGRKPHIRKPLIYFDENRIGYECMEASGLDVVIVEGTYTSLLRNTDLKVFLRRDYQKTKKDRMQRGRDPDSELMDKTLEIEHREISNHEKYADLVLDWAA